MGFDLNTDYHPNNFGFPASHQNPNNVVLDKHDVKFIWVAKGGDGKRRFTINDLCNVWAERCSINADNPSIPHYMVMHFLPILLKANAHRVDNMLAATLKDADPKGFLYSTGLEEYPGYWQALIMSIAGSFAITEGKYLPGYVRRLREMGYNVPSHWVEY